MFQLCLRLVLFSLWLAAAGALAAPAETADQAQIERGRYLSAAANCRACHSREGGAPYAGGVAFDTPFGTLYSSNITPDAATGIGGWSAADFRRAMHEGIGKAGEQLYPAFPYTDYTHMSAADVEAIRVYLASLPAVEDRPPANELMFPFNYRPLIRAWKWLNFEHGEAEREAPAERVSLERGQYLARALGHCGQCHTPRTLTYGLDESRRFAGAMQGGWYAWNISGGEAGIGSWSDAELDRYLADGKAAGQGVAAGPMAAWVSHSSRYLTDTDRAALIAYLRDVPGVESAAEGQRRPVDSPGAPASGSAEGDALYGQHCASCHAPGAPGAPGSAFTGYATVTGATPDNLIRVLLEGVQRTGASGEVFMPGYASRLTDAQIAALANEVRARYSDNPADIAAADVADIRARINR